MNKTYRLLLLALVLALLAIPTLVVFAKELGSLGITGPGIKGVMTLNHPDDMRKLEGSGFFDYNAMSAKPPEKLGSPYTITVYLNLDGNVVPFVQMDYYPREAGRSGYVHYTGRLEGEALRPVDEWGTMPSQAEAVFGDLMTAQDITLQPAVAEVAPAVAAPAVAAPAAAAPQASPAVSPLEIQPLYIDLVAGILLAIGAGLLLRRRVLSH
jgi:hypothetical protein